MKGISPIIATVLVVGFTIVMGAIVSIWGTSFILGQTQSIEEKFEEHVDCSSAVMKLERVTCNEDGSLLGMWHFEENGGSVARDSSPNGRQINLRYPIWTQGHNGRGLNLTGYDATGPIFTDSLIGWWNLDEGSGTIAADSSGNDNPGDIEGSSWVLNSSCRAGNCLGFDGGDGDYLTMGDQSEFDFGTNDFSYSIWLKMRLPIGGAAAVFNKGRTICDHGNFWYSRVDSSTGYFSTEIDDSGTNYLPLGSVRSVTDDKWHQVIYTRNGTIATIYIDGSFDATSTSSGVTNIDNSEPLEIGKSLAGCTLGFINGSIDDIRIYNHALTTDEVATEYHLRYGALNGSESLTPSKFTIEGWVYKP